MYHHTYHCINSILHLSKHPAASVRVIIVKVGIQHYLQHHVNDDKT